MKTKTSELTGAALDWAVAKCEGFHIDEGMWITDPHEPRTGEPLSKFSPSTDWTIGGEIIERGCISVVGFDPGPMRWNAHQQGIHLMEDCPTPLIAAMRCLVASKLGDEVEVPSDLL